MPELEVKIIASGLDGYKAAFRGSMTAYGVLSIKSVMWLQHVTGTGGDSAAHYWPKDCEVCKEIAQHIAEWSEPNE